METGKLAWLEWRIPVEKCFSFFSQIIEKVFNGRWSVKFQETLAMSHIKHGVREFITVFSRTIFWYVVPPLTRL